jgi:hypothetical protein
MRFEQLTEFIYNPRVKRTIFTCILFAFLTLIIFRAFLGGNTLVGSDGMGLPADFAMNQVEDSYFSAWRAFPALGHLNFPSPTLSAGYYISMEVFGLSPVALTQLLMMGSFWLAGITMYLCAHRITGSYVGGLAAGFTYQLNQVFLSQVTEGHHYFILGCAIFPILFLLIYRAIMDLDRRSAMAIPIVALLLGTVAAPNLVLILSVFISLFIISFALLAPRWHWIKRIYVLVVGGISVGLVVLPTVLMKYTAGGTPVLSTFYTVEQTQLYSSLTPYNSLVMSSTENTFIYGLANGQWTIVGQLWLLGLIVAIGVPAIAYTALFVKSQRHLVLSLLVPSILFILLATGPNPPLGDLFTAMYNNIPLMDSIRVYSRFHLLTGFAVAIFIAIVFANLKDVHASLMRFQRIPGRKAIDHIFSKKWLLAGILAICLVFPSSTIFSGEIRSFQMPESYAAPYVWVGEQDGDFRIINLPFQNVFYTSNMAHYDGYPETMTMDVGMYSPVITGKPYAFGLETKSYWSFIGAALANNAYGYRNISELLGGTASVEYIVSQAYADPKETAIFASLDGMSVARTFDGGGVVFLNGNWMPRAHPIDRLCLVSGDRSAIPSIMGLGIVNLKTDGIVMINDIVEPGTLAGLLDQADLIVVPNMDLLQFIWDTTSWEGGQTLDLQSLANKHTVNAGSAWILSFDDYYAGYTSVPTVRTSGHHDLSVPMSMADDGQYDILVKTVFRPDAGRLSVRVDGSLNTTISPYATNPHSEWVRISDVNLTSGGHDLILSNDGSGSSSVEQIIVVPHDTMIDRLSEATNLLERYKDKVIYTVSGAQSSHWVPGTYLTWHGSNGWGLSSSAVLQSYDVVSNSSLFDDPLSASGVATYINSTGLPIRPMVTGFSANVTYAVEIVLRAADGDNNDTLGSVGVWGRENGQARILDAAEITGDGSSGYLHFQFNFTSSRDMDQIEFDIVPAVGKTLYFDQISVWIQNQTYPTVGFDVPVEGDYYLKVAGANGSASSVLTIDGTEYLPITYDEGYWVYRVENLSHGPHVAMVGITDIYALLLSQAEPVAAKSIPDVTYERTSNIEYKVSVSSDRPTWILLSESYNPLWVAEMDGVELQHVSLDSMVNGYYVPEGGNHTITIHFHGQEIYGNILVEMFLMLAASIALMALVLSPRLWKGFRQMKSSIQARLRGRSQERQQDQEGGQGGN